MQYHQNIIHAHRPWMSRTYTQPSPPKGPGSTHARMMCIESAYAIAKLLQIYEVRYALRRMNIQGVGIACSAALLLIFANVTNYKAHANADVGLHLSACFRALDEFGATWESSKRAKDFLVLLQRQWELRGRTARGRRSSPTDSQDYQLSRKRTRSSIDDSQNRGPGSHQDMSPPQPQPGFSGATGPVDLDMGIDLDWIFTGDAYPLPQAPMGNL
jgi:hypothetical protein